MEVRAAGLVIPCGRMFDTEKGNGVVMSPFQTVVGRLLLLNISGALVTCFFRGRYSMNLWLFFSTALCTMFCLVIQTGWNSKRTHLAVLRCQKQAIRARQMKQFLSRRTRMGRSATLHLQKWVELQVVT